MKEKITTVYIICLLFVLCFGLACDLDRWQDSSSRKQDESSGFFSAVLGETEGLISALLYLKADVYFHRGYYPSIFDNTSESTGSKMEKTAGHPDEHGHNHEKCEKDYSREPLDWIDRFSRSFYPSVHVHADEIPRGQKEILPWLKLSATFDPHRIENYTVAAFWLRSLGKINEAEEFLRDGLRANPGNPELLFELGKIYKDDRKDITKARNILELSLARWREVTAKEKEPDTFLLQQILVHLGQLERDQRNYPLAIKYFEELKKYSPNPQAIQKQIDEMKEEMNKSAAN